jgi:glycosyltransferase involved in cell wall biosynthesis
MKVGIVVDNDLNDDKRVLREIEILKEAGYEIFVLCYGFKNKSYLVIEGINITRIWLCKSLKNILFFFINTIPAYEWVWSFKIDKFISINNINILHVHDLYMSESGWSGIRKSGTGIPMILDLHENYSYAITTYNWTRGFLRNMISRPQKWKKKEKRLLYYPKKIIVLSEEFRDHLTDEYKFLTPDHFCVLPNVPDLKQMQRYEVHRVNIAFVKKAPVILYFGVVAERRGIFDAIDSFREVITKGYDADLLVIGPIDKKDRKRFYDSISDPDIKQRITYIKWIDISELPAWLGLSDICLAPFIKNPQHESGVANKIFDYMSGKRPVIASDCLPQQKLIDKYKCGVIYRTREEFTNSIIKLLTDREQGKIMGENGYKAVLTEFNMDSKKSNLLDAYKSLLIN